MIHCLADHIVRIKHNFSGSTTDISLLSVVCIAVPPRIFRKKYLKNIFSMIFLINGMHEVFRT